MNKRSSIERNKKTIKLSLDNINGFLNFLGNPQEKYKSVIIGGTNGKGSTTSYLYSLTNKFSNLKTGKYTSPHLKTINERFEINGRIISNKKLNQYFNDLKKKLTQYEKQNKRKGSLTEFEVYTALAFYIFKEEKVNIAFLEVGLGGRLDATNVVSSKNTICSIITNINYDHMDYLGNTLRKIAYEKSGIIKERNIIITSANNEGLDVLIKESKRKQSKIIIHKIKENQTYIQKNIGLSIKCWNIICKKLRIKATSKKNTENYLKSIKIPGRFQISEKEKIVLDGAHNPDAATELKRMINEKLTRKKIIYVMGFLNKDYKKFTKILLKKNDTVILVPPKSPRATNPKTIQMYLKRRIPNVSTETNIKTALQKARTIKHDYILITGSLYLLGEALTELGL